MTVPACAKGSTCVSQCAISGELARCEVRWSGAGARLLVRLEITPIDNTMVQAFSFLGRFRMAVKNEDDRQDKGTEGKL